MTRERPEFGPDDASSEGEILELKVLELLSHTGPTSKSSPPSHATESVEAMFHQISGGAVDELRSEGILEPPTKYDELWQLALADPHTGLANQMLLLDRLTQALTRRQRHGGHVIVFHIDLNNLDAINHEFGYASGVTALRQLSRRLTSLLRTEDTVGRVGASELVAVMSIDHEDAVGSLTQRLQSAFTGAIVINDKPVRISANFGIVTAQIAETAEEILARAERASHSDPTHNNHSGR